MILKCGRNEIELNDKDVILFNGVCFILMTRKIGHSFSSYSPTVSKTRMKQLLKSGELILTKEYLDYTTSNGQEMWKRYYKINEQ